MKKGPYYNALLTMAEKEPVVWPTPARRLLSDIERLKPDDADRLIKAYLENNAHETFPKAFKQHLILERLTA